MRDLYTRFHLFISCLLLGLFTFAWLAIGSTVIWASHPLPAAPAGYVSEPSQAALLDDVPPGSVFAVLASDPGDNIIVKSSDDLIYFLAIRYDADAGFVTSELTTGGLIMASSDESSAYKDANHVINVYRATNNYSGTGNTFGSSTMILIFSMISALILIMFYSSLVVALSERRAKASAVREERAAQALAASPLKNHFGVLLTLVMVCGGLIGGGIALVVGSDSSAVAGLPANYHQQGTGSTTQLLAALPDGAKIAVFHNLNETDALALLPDGSIYFAPDVLDGAQKALLDNDGDTLAAGADLDTLRAANRLIDQNFNASSASGSLDWKAPAAAVFGVYLALLLMLLWAGFLFDSVQIRVWAKHLLN